MRLLFSRFQVFNPSVWPRQKMPSNPNLEISQWFDTIVTCPLGFFQFSVPPLHKVKEQWKMTQSSSMSLSQRGSSVAMRCADTVTAAASRRKAKKKSEQEKGDEMGAHWPASQAAFGIKTTVAGRRPLSISSPLLFLKKPRSLQVSRTSGDDPP